MSGPYTADRLHGRRVVLDRLDRDGAALAVLLCERGARVVVADPTPAVDVPEGCEHVRDAVAAVARADLLLVDCWTGESAPHVALARTRGIPVGSLADLVLHEAPCPVVGVTGTAGKTMTARLIAHLCAHAGLRVHVPPTGRAENAWPSADTLAALASGTRPDLLVLELTSTHLAYTSTSPRHAVVTALWADHVELHGSEGRYFAAKQRIFARQPADGTAVLPAGEQRIAPKPGIATFPFSAETIVERGVGVDDGRLIDRLGDRERVVCDLGRTRLAPHLWGNVACAVAAASGALGLDAAPGDAIAAFPPPIWRGETIGLVDGRPVFHDGMAATPAKARAFLQHLPERSAVLIAGGLDDLGDGPVHESPAEQRMLEQAAIEAARAARRLVLFGPAAARMAPIVARAGAREVAIGPDLHWAVGQALDDLDGVDSVAFIPGFPLELDDRARFGDLIAARAGARWEELGP